MNKCTGCGTILQNEDPSKEGYVKDINKTLCERCFKIRNYSEYKFINKNNDYYLSILKKIEKTNDLVVLVTDFLNTTALEDIKIENPIILVLSKRDLIPRHLNENKILNSIKTNLNIVDKIVIGSKNNYNLDNLFEMINKHKKSKNVYIAGYTNAGKSTLINKIIKNYSTDNQIITTSILPSTTLDLIEVKINKELTLIDTPGLIDEGSILNVTSALNKIVPKKQLKPPVIQIKNRQTIIVDNIFRIDIKNKTNLVFYMSNDLKIERFYKETTKLKELNTYKIKIKENSDLVIKGLGFIKFSSDSAITLYLKEGVKYSVRKALI